MVWVRKVVMKEDGRRREEGALTVLIRHRGQARTAEVEPAY